jgi:CheY-like chemotaxis protein
MGWTSGGRDPTDPGDGTEDTDGHPGCGPGFTRILVVEDNWLIATELEAALMDAGYEVVGLATSADQAVQLCSDEHPDLVLMDIRLRGERDGVDAAVEVRRRFDIPTVFLTAHGEPETRQRADAARPLDWILKPISSPDLIRRLARIGKS